MVLPVKSKVSLGEGITPLVRRNIYGVNLFLKLDYLQPTGSFKDRGSSVAISRALDLSVKCIVEDSSGNAGVSAAAYATSAGLKARIYVPRDAPWLKKSLIKLYNAEIVEANTRSDAFNRAVGELKPNDVYIGHLWNPFHIEGIKTIAYELYEQLGETISNATIISPVASGTLLLGLFKGFSELARYGFISSIPKLIAVQAYGIAPIYEKIHGSIDWKFRSVLADALRVEAPPRVNEIIKALKDTNGDCVVVNDDEIRQSLKALLSLGFIVEPSSAVAIAAVKKLIDCKYVPKGEHIVSILTGSGVKTINLLLSLF